MTPPDGISTLPEFVPVRQALPRPQVGDMELALEQAFRGSGLAERLTALRGQGRSAVGGQLRDANNKPVVGITVGSRGIGSIAAILRSAARLVAAQGARPVFLAAMGSHGGGTAAGQRAILAALGLDEGEGSLGAPIVFGPGGEVVARTVTGLPVNMHPAAADCDLILVVNRVKPHTSFMGSIASGLSKMVAVGLGQQAGAQVVHSMGPEGMEAAITEITRAAIATGRIGGGLAIVENAYGDVAELHGVPAHRFLEADARLLQAAQGYMPGLPVDDIDLLVIRQFGKDFSGTGMDPNVTGRWGVPALTARSPVTAKRLVALDLSNASKGNANGIGLADFTTSRVEEKMDRGATYLNCITTGLLDRGKLPLVFPTDRRAIEAAWASLDSPTTAVIIANTLHLDALLVSTTVLDGLRAAEGSRAADGFRAADCSRAVDGDEGSFITQHGLRLEVTGPSTPLQFDDTGALAT